MLAEMLMGRTIIRAALPSTAKPLVAADRSPGAPHLFSRDLDKRRRSAKEQNSEQRARVIMAHTLPELRARADEIGREWERLHGAINEVARIHAEENVVAAFRVLHDMAMAVGQRRLELELLIASQVGPPRQHG